MQKYSSLLVVSIDVCTRRPRYGDEPYVHAPSRAIKEKVMMIEDANKHATACIAMLEAGKLADALAYCAAQRVDPAH